MQFLLVFALVVAVTSVKVIRIRRSAHNEYKMCVAEHLLEICNQMAAQETKSTAKIICVSERDRSECIESVKERKADFIFAEPEDMLIAAKLPNQDFAVFEEVRTVSEPDAEFRYEGVVVIHKNLKINSIKELKGLKSCHTGIGRNVGYTIPITKLKNMGIIGNLADPQLSPRENELKELSQLFNKSCIVGKWSLDPDIDKKLKKKYNNLCGMCEHPEICDYPDNYSGYEGALRCLVHNGGDVAFTKVVYVKKFFGLTIGSSTTQLSKENPDDYAYLCADGTRLPVRGTPCRWASRPWPGYIANAVAVKKVDDLRKKLENLYTVGKTMKAPWLEKILELSTLTHPKESKVIGPEDYLDKANYTDVLERDYGPPYKSIKFCVFSDLELRKCRQFSDAAFSRDIRPRFDCVLHKSTDECFKAIRDGGADAVSVTGNLVLKSQREFNLKPIASELKLDIGTDYYAVAVVKKNSVYKSFEDLRGAKSCHARFGYGSFTGLHAPIYVLIKLGFIQQNQCPYSAALSEFFSGGSCMPGAKNSVYKLPKLVSDRLCSQCGGEGDSKCNSDASEPYYMKGAFRCLVEGKGDVAFLVHKMVIDSTDGKSSEAWAANLKSEDYELLCPYGGRVSINQYEKCNLAHVPTRMVVTNNAKSNGDIDEIVSALISAGDLYNKRPDLFRLFGKYEGQSNLLFMDYTRGLKAVHNEVELLEDYDVLLKTSTKC